MFISFSDFTSVGIIFTAAVSQHLSSSPCLSIFIRVGIHPTDFDLCFFKTFFSF